jgi:hypothetical protein
METLNLLAELIRSKNSIEKEIANIVGRPAMLGHVGEYIAAKIFNISLEASAVNKGSDGKFISGPLKESSVNIKWYTKQSGLLDITPDFLPDYYLVLTGEKTSAGSSRGTNAPWIIKMVYLHKAESLIETLIQRRVKIGKQVSVAQSIWEGSQIYPLQKNNLLTLSVAQKKMITLFQLAE